MRRGHPLEADELTLPTLATADHISLRAVPSATAQIDDHMRDASLARRIKVTTSQVAAIPHMLIDTDLVACILGVCAQTVSQILPDTVIRRLVPIDPVEIRLVWHSEIINTTAAAWLRNEILEVAADITRAPQLEPR
jgi:DNA-binding transcriptional LysR family regulator